MAGHASPNPFDQQKPITGVRHVVLVGSGKGGVGKSTVATNLALALAKCEARVGLLDADIYGPSIPRMWGTLGQRPEVNDNRRIEPLVRFHVRLMSMGYLIDDSAAVVWRGPMLFKAIDQFCRDVEWGELDYLIIDLPPGTGDIPLTLAQKVPISGAVVVSTPQNVALHDVKKAVDMFERLGVRLLGLVENMAYFTPPGSTEKIALFPKGDLDTYLQTKSIEKLAEIPFHTPIALGGEAGIPIVESASRSAEAQAFLQVARRMRELLG